MLLDQRHGFGLPITASPADVEARWQAIVQRGHRFLDEDGTRARTEFVETGDTLPARVNDGRWIADCPCGSGLLAWPDNPRGCCMNCGSIFTIEYPAQADVDAATVVLGYRPRAARNWRPFDGETVDELKAENVLRAFAFV